MGLCSHVYIHSLTCSFIYPSIQLTLVFYDSFSDYRKIENWGNFGKCRDALNKKERESLLISLVRNNHCSHFGVITSNFLSYEYNFFFSKLESHFKCIIVGVVLPKLAQYFIQQMYYN